MARVTNEQIVAKLDTLIDVLTKSALEVTATAAPTEQSSVEQEPTIKVTENYRKVMNGKAQDHATKHGEEVVLYARRNKANEVKLAFALRPRFDTLQDARFLGVLAAFQPK